MSPAEDYKSIFSNTIFFSNTRPNRLIDMIASNTDGIMQTHSHSLIPQI